ncbi:hypothetical protein KVH31_34920 [Streptomyces olivaceus]|uniref:hypothetical protein n=1 Tax=Streptomyces olivaceus TaxID=47716 RepID=UPI001CCE438D|nr:hypothetical protein [Streptomyces olivaceus]MBZ6211691.1 hypothetical protein [Streptomyces olivaceus]
MTDRPINERREQKLVEAHQATIGELRATEGRLRLLEAEVTALRQFRTWLADQVARAERADQITEERGGVRDELKISPHNGLAAGLRTALLGLDQHLTQTKGT